VLKSWEKLSDELKNDKAQRYYDILQKKRASLFLKRIFDIFMAIILVALLIIPMAIIAAAIKIDSKGPAIFRQVRVTKYGKRFRIFKFRTMVSNSETLGTQVTTQNDARVTKLGKILRKYRLDEIPQIFNILAGDMTFVGCRPEVEKYVEKYTDEMMATLFLSAGITSEASIRFKDEERLLSASDNPEEAYINEILPKKMRHNLEAIEKFSFLNDIRIMLMTVTAVVRGGNK
jgi:lipopolysaccharide/colanic/teichoic acid biosynthesis glycosyltransferase